jgi:hypothetical protein
MSSSKSLMYGSLVATTMCSVAMGFQSPIISSTSTTPFASSSTTSSTRLGVAVDPTVVTKKDYQDICGVSFDSEGLQKRLQATNFLYPKHVEVVEDIAPIAGAMVDDVVRRALFVRSFEPFASKISFFLVL